MLDQEDQLNASFFCSQALCTESLVLLTDVANHFYQVLLSVNGNMSGWIRHVIAHIKLYSDSFNTVLAEVVHDVRDSVGLFSRVKLNTN